MLTTIYEKIVLYKIKKIIIDEFYNPYYQNAANVLEIVDLGTERIIEETNKYKYTDHVKNMYIYQNGFIIFNDFIRVYRAFPEIDNCNNNKVKHKVKKSVNKLT